MHISEKGLILALLGIMIFVGTAGADDVWVIAEPGILPVIAPNDFSTGTPLFSGHFAAFEQSLTFTFSADLPPNPSQSIGVPAVVFPVFSDTISQEFSGPNPLDNPKAYHRAPSGARYISCIL